MAEVQTGMDGSFDVQNQAIEDSKIEAAKAELVDEQQEDSGLILGKYQSTEDLAKAYQSLQAEYTKLKGGQQPAETEAAPDPEPAQPVAESPKSEAPSVTQQQSEQVQAAVLNHVGGQDKFNSMASWANQALTDEAKQAFNEAINSGHEGRALTAVKALQYDYSMANGFEPRLVGGRPAATQEKGFASEAQVVAAMSDPRYLQGSQHDPAYVEEVQRKLSISQVFEAG